MSQIMCQIFTILLLHAVYNFTQAFGSACRRSEQWYGSDKGYVTVAFMIVIILPLATKLCTQRPQIIQLSFLLQSNTSTIQQNDNNHNPRQRTSFPWTHLPTSISLIHSRLFYTTINGTLVVDMMLPHLSRHSWSLMGPHLIVYFCLICMLHL
jgi:hypothetical protein